MLPYTPSAVADAILTILDAAATTSGSATLAIPGGRSPGESLTILARRCDAFLRKHLHLLWVDERAVPIGHPDRNDAATLSAWRAGGALPLHVHAMPAEAPDLQAAAHAYGALIATLTRGQGLDVCLLGMGEDGHCASLFPEHPALRDLSPVIAITDSPKPPPGRLTVGLTTLHAAHHCVVLALGSEKGLMAQRARQGPDPRIPVSLLPPARTMWFLDDAAVQAVQGLRAPPA
jgi:6-phosphogluconolactonase